MEQGVKVIPVFELHHSKVKPFEDLPNRDEDQDLVGMACQVSLGGADEVAFIDVDEVRMGFKIWEDAIHLAKTAAGIPVLFGYSMNTYDDFEDILNSGIDRVIIDVKTDTDQSIIDRLSQKFGKERIVVAVGGRKNLPESGKPESGKPEFELVHHNGGQPTGINLIDWLKMAEFLGAGAALLTSHDTAGLGQGYDIVMTKAVTSAVSIPIIAAGGAGEIEHFYQVVHEAAASGVAASSVFSSGKLRPSEIKEYLESRNIKVVQ